jgi:D-alanine-D-alanine ligase
VSDLRVLVLAGGISHERDVSLKSGRRVADALTDAGVTTEIREPDSELVGHLMATRPDVVWSTLHGAVGEDGSLQNLLQLAGIPFVGSNSAGARLAWDKTVAKVLVAKQGIQTPESITLPKSSFRELNAESVLAVVGTELGFPVAVKPAKSGSAQGFAKVSEPKSFAKAMVDAFAYCDQVIIERFIDGTELAVSVIDLGKGPVALPAVEIVPDSGEFGYSERYTAGKTSYYVPARFDEQILAEAARIAVSAHESLGLNQLSRVDLIVDEEGQIWFLEANVTPGMTETSLFPQAVLASDATLPDTYLALVKLALKS